MSLKEVRFLLSDLLFEYESKYGMIDERTKRVRKAWLTICEEMERNGETL